MKPTFTDFFVLMQSVGIAGYNYGILSIEN